MTKPEMSWLVAGQRGQNLATMGMRTVPFMSVRKERICQRP